MSRTMGRIGYTAVALFTKVPDDKGAREVFAHNTFRLARPGTSTTRRCARYILRRLMIDRATVAAVARKLGLSWDTGRLAAGCLTAAKPARCVNPQRRNCW
jgi:Helix-turn-helix domain of transposase family ISL3